MNFEEILDQAIAMLQRRSRVTYRTLKRQFQLDDDALEDLKEELIYGQRLAVDEDGRVLVWTGDASTSPALISSPPPHQGEPLAAHHTRVASLAAEPCPAEAERRQLTVLFCDLVDSTALAGKLDPEDLREVVRAYQDTCAKVIARFDGHIAQYLGDGLLVYFGYPLAHEDDAQRAVRAGLGMVEALGQLNARLGQEGIAQPLEVYQVLYESTARSRLEVAGSTGLTPLVGREQEIGLLRERWAQVKDGLGQVVLLSGEAGIGKSRLVQVVSTHVAGTPHGQWACRSVPTAHYSAFAPVLDLLQQVLDYQPDDSPAAKLHKLETTLASYPLALPEAVPLLAALLAVPLDARYAPLTLPPEQQRQRTLETGLTVLRGLAAQPPGLLIVEDLHWVDPSTLELLSMLVAQAATAHLYVLLTWRPEFQPPWPSPAHLPTLTLGRLLPP